MTSSPASICVCVHVRVSAPWVAPVQVKACACVHLLGGIKIVIDYSLTVRPLPFIDLSVDVGVLALAYMCAQECKCALSNLRAET